MKNISLFIYCVIIFSATIFYSQIKNKNFTEGFEEGNEEIEKMHQRELDMLADPATGKIPENIRSKEINYYKDFLQPLNNHNKRGNSWYSAGPWNVGGRTRTIALDIKNENIILAGSVSGGIWRSTDAGKTWTKSTLPLQHPGVVSISQDKRPGKENIWYALSGEGYGTSASGGSAFYLGDGAFKSTDGGISWKEIASTSSFSSSSFTSDMQIGWRIATHPSTDSDFVYMATYGSIFRSNNGGNTWRRVLGDGSSYYFTDIAITTTGVLYATITDFGVPFGFYRSTDGLNWKNITPTQYLSQCSRTVMGINPNNENEVLFFSYHDSTNVNAGGTVTSNYKDAEEWIGLFKYTYLSGDGTGTGGQWQDLSANLPDKVNITSGSFDKLNCQGGYDMTVAYQPGTNAIFIAGTNIFRSTDGFSTKNNTTQIGGYKPATVLPFFEIYPKHHPDNHEMLFLPSDNSKLLSASDGGVRITDDANASEVTWTSLNDGYITSQIYTATIDQVTPNDKWLIGGFQDNGNFMSTDMDDATHLWVMPFNGDGAYNYIAPLHEFCVLSIQEGKIVKFKIDNNGNKVAYRRIDPIGPAKEDYGFINPFVVDPNDNNILYLPAGKALYRQSELTKIELTNEYDSLQQGWTKIFDSANNEITAIAVSKKPANVVYIGTRARNIYKITNANSSNPIVKNITKNPLPNGNTYVSSIAIDPDDANKALFCYSNYNIQSLYYTDNGGDSIKYCGGNLEDTSNSSSSNPSIRWVSIMKTPTGGKKYFAGTSVGLYSTDSLVAYRTPVYDTTKWIQESPNLIGANIVGHITYRQSDYTIAVATHGNGIFVSKYFDSKYTNAIDQEITIFPNPVSNVLNIKTSNFDENNASLIVSDMSGKVVYKQIGVLITAKQNYYTFPTHNLSSGIYTLRFILPNKKREIVRKFVVSKG